MPQFMRCASKILHKFGGLGDTQFLCDRAILVMFVASLLVLIYSSICVCLLNVINVNTNINTESDFRKICA